MLREVKSIPTGLSNIIKWLPIIYQDRDYDEHYLYLILLKKLKNKEKFFRGDNAFTMDAPIVADEIKEIVIALERLTDCDGEDVYFREACKEVGIRDYNSAYTRGNREIWDAEERLLKEDIEKIFPKELSEKIRGWWD